MQQQPLPNTLEIPCRRGAQITPELQREAANLMANVVCSNVPNTTLTVDLSQLSLPVQTQPNGRPTLYFDSSIVRRIEQDFGRALDHSNVEEILSAQMRRPVNAWVNTQGRPQQR